MYTITYTSFYGLSYRSFSYLDEVCNFIRWLYVRYPSYTPIIIRDDKYDNILFDGTLIQAFKFYVG